MIADNEKLPLNRRAAAVLLTIVAAVMLWYMLGAYTTHGRSHYRPIRSQDSLAAVVTPPH